MSDTKLTAEESCRQVLKSIAEVDEPMAPRRPPKSDRRSSAGRGPSDVACVDLFCGAGGLTHGLIAAGVPVVAGVDLDEACRHPYQANNPGATFYARAGATGSGGRALRGRDD